MRLDQVADVIDPHPSHRAPPESKDGIPFPGIGDFREDGTIDQSTCRRIDESVYNEHRKRYEVADGDLGFGRVASIGKVIRLRTDNLPYAVSPTLAIIKPRQMDSTYLQYFLQGPQLNEQIGALLTGTTRSSLGIALLRALQITFPDTPEQQQIGIVLSKLDRAIEKTKALISKQQRIKTGLVQDFLTKGIDEHGNIRTEATHAFKDSPLGRIPVEWDIRSCAELCTSIVVGIVIRPTQYYKDAGVPVLRSANVRENQVTTEDLVFMSEEDNRILKKSQVREGDLVTVRTGYPGTTAVVPQELNGANCVDILISRPDVKRIRSHYLAMWINSDFGKKQVLEGQGGLAQQHFNVGQMRMLLVKTPPTNEQEQIESILLAHRENDGRLYEQLEKLRRHKVGLMHDLLTGKRRITPLLEHATQQ